jgi:sulfate adenylyltransferase subunit 1
MGLLRFTTAGNVDDGKSTLVGRLLYDSRAILDDQLEAVRQASTRRGDGGMDLALITDGLRAEREQGITIDVAYRYFATARRKFIIADTPGHVQYTRNMVTGASTANLALILVDVRKGAQEQTRRHAYIAGLLGIRHIVFCVNKMDLVDYAEERFAEVQQELEDLSSRLEVPDIRYVPISAKHGDMIVERGDRMPWYQGPTLLHLLENVHTTGDADRIRRRLPVQSVLHHMGPDGPERFVLGRVAGGVFRVGDPVVVLPGGQPSTIRSICIGERMAEECFAPQSVAITLDDEIDIGRGDMIVGPNQAPDLRQDLDVMLCWFDGRPVRVGDRFVLRQGPATTRCSVKELVYRMDIATLRKTDAGAEVPQNGIARVRLRTAIPLAVDSYARNRATGSLILIDEATNVTVGAGMVV